MEGFITLHRKLIKWEWYHKSNMVHLFVHLILSANHEEKRWQGHLIKRGQVIIGRKKLSESLGFTEQSLRTCLDRLKSTNEITIESTKLFSLVTIVNYDKYQQKKRESTKQLTKSLTNNQPTSNQPLTTTNNENNFNNETKKGVYEKKKLADNVSVTEEEHTKLIGLLRENLMRLVNDVSKYKIKSGKQYASDYQAIVEFNERQKSKPPTIKQFITTGPQSKL